MSTLALFFARLSARKIGADEYGNVYFESRRPMPVYGRKRRYVVLARGMDSSNVPPEWHGWLHHTTDEVLPRPRYPWLRPHQSNMTGTALAYRPRGHDYSGGQRRVTGGDYEAWTPGS
jgi:NADH:ubiquinone oxidoreductase subunit